MGSSGPISPRAPSKAPLPSSADLAIRLTSRGRGVFARRAFAAGERIECCLVLLADAADVKGLLDPYVFCWEERFAIATGFGSFYNHSYEPSARFTRDLEQQMILITALRAIAPGEEIEINYNGDPALRDPLWFDVVPTAPSEP